MEIIALVLLLEGLFFAGTLGPACYGSALLRKGKAETALPWFQWCYRCSRLLRGWRGVMALNISSCHINLGDLAAALPYAEEGAAETARLHQPKFHALARAQEGMILARIGENAQAQKVMEEVFASPLPLRYAVWIKQYAAVVYVNAGRFDEAERLINDVLAAKKCSPDLQVIAGCIVGRCRYYRGETAEALEAARRAAGISSNLSWVHAYAQSECLLYQTELGATEEARKIEAEVRPLLPTLSPQIRSSALRAFGQLALRTGDLDKARACAEQAVMLDPNPNAQAAALLIQAEVFAARHNRHRALALCDEIARLHPLDFYGQRVQALRGMPASSSEPAVTSSLEAPAEQTLYLQ